MNAQQLEVVTGSPEVSGSVNPGEILRATRLDQGLSEAEVAATLRLPRRTLEYLESGQFDRLPGDTFARGYIRAYARMLNIDPNGLVTAYDQHRGIESRERAVSGINKIASYSTEKSNRLLTRSGTMLVLVAIVTSGLWWWYEGRTVEPVTLAVDTSDYIIEEVQVDALSMPVAIPGVRTVSMQAPEEQVIGASAALSTEVAPAQQVEATASDANAPVLAGTEPSALEAAEPASAPQPEPAALAKGLRMSFRADCWVQVSTPAGQVLHSALMRSGQSFTVEHDGPLDLVVGAVEAVVSTEFQGEQITLANANQSGVVRTRLSR